MDNINNCESCGKLYMKKIRSGNLCDTCYKEEEKIFDVVYRYIRKSTNRTASIKKIVEDTNVSEKQLYEWIRIGRLRVSHMPNLGYPCSKCGVLIQEGKLCESCKDGLVKGLEEHEKKQNTINKIEKERLYKSDIRG